DVYERQQVSQRIWTCQVAHSSYPANSQSSLPSPPSPLLFFLSPTFPFPSPLPPLHRCAHTLEPPPRPSPSSPPLPHHYPPLPPCSQVRYDDGAGARAVVAGGHNSFKDLLPFSSFLSPLSLRPPFP
ncbi:unnamed protein product, partial [Closterium sp. NIES-54]